MNINFIRDPSEGLIYIGYKDIETLQEGNPRVLELVLSVKSKYQCQELYKTFRCFRVIGKWYQPSKGVLWFINKLKENPDLYFRIKIKRPTPLWPQSKIDYLKIHYPEDSKRIIMKELGLDWSQIKSKAKSLKIHRTKHKK